MSDSAFSLSSTADGIPMTIVDAEVLLGDEYIRTGESGSILVITTVTLNCEVAGSGFCQLSLYRNSHLVACTDYTAGTLFPQPPTQLIIVGATIVVLPTDTLQFNVSGDAGSISATGWCYCGGYRVATTPVFE